MTEDATQKKAEQLYTYVTALHRALAARVLSLLSFAVSASLFWWAITHPSVLTLVTATMATILTFLVSVWKEV